MKIRLEFNGLQIHHVDLNIPGVIKHYRLPGGDVRFEWQPTQWAKRLSEAYKVIKREIGDDWTVDLNAHGENWDRWMEAIEIAFSDEAGRIADEIDSWTQDACMDMAYHGVDDLGDEHPDARADDMYSDEGLLRDLIGDRLCDETHSDRMRNAVIDELRKIRSDLSDEMWNALRR